MNSPIQPNAPTPVGRPRALDDVKLGEVSALISLGSGLEAAARYVGCAASTIRREARRNPIFNDQLRRAHMSAEIGPLKALREAALKDWRAALCLLERLNPQRFAKQNARHVKPEHLREFIDVVGELLLAEVTDRNTRRRVVRRLNKLVRKTEANTIATELDPAPKRANPRRTHF